MIFHHLYLKLEITWNYKNWTYLEKYHHISNIAKNLQCSPYIFQSMLAAASHIWICLLNTHCKIPPSFRSGILEALAPYVCYLPFPLWCTKQQIWQVSLQQIRLCTHASRLDLTVPSTPIKSEAQREKCVNPVWRAAPSTQSVDVASPLLLCFYFLADMWKHLFRLLFIRVHGWGFTLNTETVPLSLWPVSVSKGGKLSPSVFISVIQECCCQKELCKTFFC